MAFLFPGTEQDETVIGVDMTCVLVATLAHAPGH